jgi:hypothetical protein
MGRQPLFMAHCFAADRRFEPLGPKLIHNIRLDKYSVNEHKLRPGFLGDVGRPDFRTPNVAPPARHPGKRSVLFLP